MVMAWAALACLCGPGLDSAQADTDIQWTWMKGASVVSQSGVYTSPSPSVCTPGARQKAVSWTDSSGTAWVFGGTGWDSAGNRGCLSDLWKHNPTSGNWTWVSGANTIGQPGDYGIPKMPASSNIPGARYQAASWTDASGLFWLFGGYGLDSAGIGEGYLNDLWKFDPVTGYWTWIKGASAINPSGTYGALRTPASANTPGGRGYAASWTDSSGALWLFGGYGYDGTGTVHRLNDLWRFDPVTEQWAWMKGSSTVDKPGVYNVAGAPETNTPGARLDTASWNDLSGNLWLFGGYGYDSTGSAGYLNDLWKYDPVTGNWTWMKGNSIIGSGGSYGVQGTEASSNNPGARNGAVSWADTSGNLWLFGGSYLYDLFTLGFFNDLRKFDTLSGNWTWMKGEKTIDQFGTYGTLGTPAAKNTPGARFRGITWANAGALWLFGGNGRDSAGNVGDLNDLWRMDVPDKVPPTGAIVINNNQSVTNNPNTTLSLAWSDGIGSGVVRMKFSNDSVTWSAWEPLAATKAWTLSAGDGYKTVRAMFRDKAGNNSLVHSDYIRLDTVPPTGSIIINGGASSTKKRTVSLGLTWSDGTGSGVTRMRFSMDGATWSYWEPQYTPKPYTLPAVPGHYTVRVTFRDAGGNISERYSDYIRLDAP